MFVAAYGSGNLYIFNTEQFNKLGTESPTFTLNKQGDSFNIYVVSYLSNTTRYIAWLVEIY